MNRPILPLKFLDHTLCWNAADLERKLASFQSYFNEYRVHSVLGGPTPAEVSGERENRQATLHRFRFPDETVISEHRHGAPR